MQGRSQLHQFIIGEGEEGDARQDNPDLPLVTLPQGKSNWIV